MIASFIAGMYCCWQTSVKTTSVRMWKKLQMLCIVMILQIILEVSVTVIFLATL